MPTWNSNIKSRHDKRKSHQLFVNFFTKNLLKRCRSTFHMSEKPKIQEIQIIYHATTRWPLSEMCTYEAKKMTISEQLHFYHQKAQHDACMGYQNDPNNVRNHDFGILSDYGYIWTHIGSKCVPTREKMAIFQLFCACTTS